MRLRIAIIISILLLGAVFGLLYVKLNSIENRVRPALVTVTSYNKNGKAIARAQGFFVDPKHIITCRSLLVDARSIKAGKYGNLELVGQDQVTGIIALRCKSKLAVKPLTLSKAILMEGEPVSIVTTDARQKPLSGKVEYTQLLARIGNISHLSRKLPTACNGLPIIDSKGQATGIAVSRKLDGKSVQYVVCTDVISQLLKNKSKSTDPGIRSEWPDTAQGLHNKGVMFRFARQTQCALNYFLRATEKDPEYYDAWTRAGACYGRLGQYNNAERVLRKAIAINPGKPGAYYFLGYVFQATHRLEEAVKQFETSARLSPKNTYYLVALGWAYSDINYRKDAINSIRKAIALDPDAASNYDDLGCVYIRFHDYTHALDAFQKAINRNPYASKYYASMGTAYYGLRQPPKAIDAFSKAVEINPEDAAAYYGLGLAYGRMNRYEQALEAYQKEAELKPKDASSHLDVAWAQQKLHQYSDSATSCKKATRIDPQNFVAWIQLGNNYKHLNKLPLAIQAYHKAIEVNPKSSYGYTSVAYCHYKSKNYQEAIKAYNQAIRMDPKSSLSYRGVGCSYMMLKQYAKAESALKKALQLAPQASGAYINLASLYLRQGKISSAEKIQRSLKKIDSKAAGKLSRYIWAVKVRRSFK